MVLKDGKIALEKYYLTGGPEVQWISWSVAKSFVSTLVGIAYEEGYIKNLDEPITNYIDVKAGSAYDNVPIKDILQMSSGARWDEAYNNPESDVRHLGAAVSPEGSLDAFVSSMVKETTPGTVCRYNSGDTQALGMLVSSATKRTLTDYMQEKLVEPLGLESDSYWLLDGKGVEMAFAGLNMTARDFAKLGELFRCKGNWRGTQIISQAWIEAAITPDAPHLELGQPYLSENQIPLAYGYQWWIPEGNDGVYCAMGIYNQFIYIDPSRNVVIVKLSASRNYGTTMTQETNKEFENIAVMEAIAKQFD
ncbi:serine hydrolase domain-containing protein [Pseudomonas laurentiana]